MPVVLFVMNLETYFNNHEHLQVQDIWTVWSNPIFCYSVCLCRQNDQTCKKKKKIVNKKLKNLIKTENCTYRQGRRNQWAGPPGIEDL